VLGVTDEVPGKAGEQVGSEGFQSHPEAGCHDDIEGARAEGASAEQGAEGNRIEGSDSCEMKWPPDRYTRPGEGRLAVPAAMHAYEPAPVPS
jgi:hypothetical protein